MSSSSRLNSSTPRPRSQRARANQRACAGVAVAAPVEEADSSDTDVPQGRSTPFPRRLFAMIVHESQRNRNVVRWSKDGRAFFVDNEEAFINDVLPRYAFKASKMQSFQRNLNIYGFQRISKGAYAGGYVHPRFSMNMDKAALDDIGREQKGLVKRKRSLEEMDEDRMTEVKRNPDSTPRSLRARRGKAGSTTFFAHPVQVDASDAEFDSDSEYDPGAESPLPCKRSQARGRCVVAFDAVGGGGKRIVAAGPSKLPEADADEADAPARATPSPKPVLPAPATKPKDAAEPKRACAKASPTLDATSTAPTAAAQPIPAAAAATAAAAAAAAKSSKNRKRKAKKGKRPAKKAKKSGKKSAPAAVAATAAPPTETEAAAAAAASADTTAPPQQPEDGWALHTCLLGASGSTYLRMPFVELIPPDVPARSIEVNSPTAAAAAAAAAAATAAATKPLLQIPHRHEAATGATTADGDRAMPPTCTADAPASGEYESSCSMPDLDVGSPRFMDPEDASWLEDEQELVRHLVSLADEDECADPPAVLAKAHADSFDDDLFCSEVLLPQPPADCRLLPLSPQRSVEVPKNAPLPPPPLPPSSPPGPLHADSLSPLPSPLSSPVASFFQHHFHEFFAFNEPPPSPASTTPTAPSFAAVNGQLDTKADTSPMFMDDASHFCDVGNALAAATHSI